MEIYFLSFFLSFAIHFDQSCNKNIVSNLVHKVMAKLEKHSHCLDIRGTWFEPGREQTIIFINAQL